MPDEEDQTQNRQGDQPRHVVDEESQIERILLSIVICTQVDWLKVVLEATSHR